MTNGFLPLSSLAPITGGVRGAFAGSGYLARAPAAAWNACAVEAHRATGRWLSANGPDSAYRSYARQQYWKSYWCSRGACENAATPGSSNHGLGYAVDNSATGYLLDRYGSKYGWRRSCSDAPWESWHWKWCGGWSGHDPGPYGAGGGVRNKYPVLKRGKKGAAVKRLQRHLRRWAWGLTRPREDGDFGKTTEKAVRQFQTAYGLRPDGVVGKNTWRYLRHKQYCYADERYRVNKIKFAANTGHGVGPGERDRIRNMREWCLRRARSIAEVAKTHGWKGENRGKRYKILRRAAGPLAS